MKGYVYPESMLKQIEREFMQPTRTDLLNHLVKNHNLKTYLEIGVQVPEINFGKIECDYKVGVDPALPYMHEIYDGKTSMILNKTSDQYFETEFKKFDLIFIDGLHTAEQVKKDFCNAWKILSPKGFIVLHDCNPLKEEHTIVPRPTPTGHWNGDVYKFAASMADMENSVRLMNGADKCAHTVDIDNGCLVFQDYYPLGLTDFFTHNDYHEITWDQFNKNRKELLNLISWDEFVKIHKN